MYEYYYLTGFAASTAVPPATDWYDYLLAEVPTIKVLYKLDEPSGTTMADSSGNAHDGTYVDTPTLAVSGPVSGHTGATFDGISQAGTVAPHADMNPGTADFTVGMWLKASSWAAASSFDYVFCHEGDGAAGEWENPALRRHGCHPWSPHRRGDHHDGRHGGPVHRLHVAPRGLQRGP